MAARGPRFAWWVIPATLGVGVCTSLGIAAFAGSHYVEPKDLSIPPGFVDAKYERRGDGIDHQTLDRDFVTLAEWTPADTNHGGHFELGQFVDPAVVDEAFVAELERLQHSRTGASFSTQTARMEKHDGRAVGVVEVSDGDRRVRIATTQIRDDTFVMVGISSRRDEAVYAPAFAHMLESLGRLGPRRRQASAHELRQAALPGLAVGGLLCLPLAFAISVWRRRVWERTRLDQVAPLPPRRKSLKASAFAWRFFAGGLIAGGVIGAVVGDMLHRDRPVDARDLVAPPGYVPEALYGFWLGAVARRPGDPAMLATWRKPGTPGLLWVARLPDDAPPLLSDRMLLESVERHVREAAARSRRSMTVKQHEIRSRAGRSYGYFDVVTGDIDECTVVMRIGRSQLLLSSLAPTEHAEAQRDGFDALVDQVARLPPPLLPRAKRRLAASKAALIGLCAGLLPAIGLGAVFRRRQPA